MKEYINYTLTELQKFQEELIKIKPQTFMQKFAKVSLLCIVENLIEEKQQNERI